VRFTLTAKKKRLATWTRHSLKGTNAFTFAKKLKTGAYTMSVALNATAKSSAALRVR